MRRKAFILILLTTLAVAGWRLRPCRVEFTNLPPRATGPWVAFGDSLTVGFGATEAHDYPTLLGQRLGVGITNLGVNGNTTVDGLQRVEDVARLNPRVVLLCLGGNDGLQQMPRAQMFANLATITRRLQADGSFVVLLGVRSTTLRDKNSKPFEELARAMKTLLVPNILDGLLTDPRLMADQIHPNDQGYARIAERVEQALLPVLTKLQAATETNAVRSAP